jgi:hypothetical protein
MHRTTYATLLLSFAGSLAAQAPARGAPSKILAINIEEVKPGKAQAHSSMEEKWATAYVGTKLPYYSFAFTRMAGPDEVWYVQPWSSYTEMAGAQKAFAGVSPAAGTAMAKYAEQESEFLERHRALILEYRPEFSLGDSVDFGSVHGYKAIVYRVPFAHTMDFELAAKTWVAAAKKAGVTQPVLTYEVTQGAAGVGMMMLFVPFKSIAEYDEDMATSGRIVGAMAADERDAFFKAVSTFSGSETFTLELQPRQSFVPQAIAQADPAFWKSSPQVAARNAKKAGVVQAGAPKKKNR